MYRRYSSVNDMPIMVKYNEKERGEKEVSDVHKNEEVKNRVIKEGKLFEKFELDDIIILIIIFILMADDCDDKLLLLMLGFIFVNGLE